MNPETKDKLFQEMKEDEIFLCDCGSLSHVYQLYYDVEFNDLHWYISIRPQRNFFKRVWRALGYIFNKKARYGDYDGFIVNPDDIKRIRPFLDRCELNDFLNHNPAIAQHGISCWGDADKFHRWLLGSTVYSRCLCGGRVIDMGAEQIEQELSRIEHGIFA